MTKNIVGLIPTRLNSQRLPQKALLEIHGIPLIVHTYRRALMSKKLNDLFTSEDFTVVKLTSGETVKEE